MGAVFDAAVASRKGQLTCEVPGWQEGWSGDPTWTFTDCGPAAVPDPIYKCVTADNSPVSSIDGVEASEATLFRDGKEHTVTWGVLKPTNEIAVTDASTRWTRSGSPWRENGLSIRESTLQLSSRPGGGTLFNSDSGTSNAPGSLASAYVKATWASNEFAGPTLLTPQWNYFGNLQQEGITINGMDSNGNWSASPTTVTVASSAQCQGQSVALTYVRAKQQ
jgi:hypothetical protein